MKKLKFLFLAAALVSFLTSFGQDSEMKHSDNTIAIIESAIGDGFKTVLEDSNLPETAAISSFQLTFFTNGTWLTFPCSGDKLSSEGKTALGELETGHKLYVEKIVSMATDGTDSKLAAFELRVP